MVWIATDHYPPLRGEYFDRQEQFFKTVLRFEEIKLDAGLEEDLFTRERLERG